MKRNILIIAAMDDVELNYLNEKLENSKTIEYKGFKFFEGKLKDKNVILCASNIGLINAATAITIAIEKYNPYMIINEGLAGGYTSTLKKGEIVVGTDAINITSMEYKGDGNSIENYELTTFLYGEDNKLISRSSDKRIINFIKDNFAEYELHFGRIASGDIWNKNHERINCINKKYEAICEDMEAVAIYTVANLYKIPVVSIKGISNNEILGESYDYSVSKKLQSFVEEIVLKIDENMLLFTA